MSKMTVKDIDVDGKRILVRVDFNVPLDKNGEIVDDSRIRAALPTIRYLIDRGAKIILLSHLGRPKGNLVPELRLGNVGRRLSEIIERPVPMASDCVGPEVEKSVAGLKNGDILLLENLRFHFGEESDDTSFAQALARLGEVFVNDAFGTSHRAHASTVGITRYLPGVAGFLMEKELLHLGGILKNPAHPFALLLGGAKINDKVGMIDNIMDKVDVLLIGGAMAATFLKAKSCDVGRSLLETDMLSVASRLTR
jgi:phosphoglycerate kinase